MARRFTLCILKALITSVRILGVRVDDATMQEAITRVDELMCEPRLHQIATVNPEFVMKARSNPIFAQVLSKSDLNVPDGANLLRAARWLKQPLRERVAGSDLIEGLCARASEEGWRVFFLGGRGGVSERAGQILLARYPALQIAGIWEGTPAPSEYTAIIGKINGSGAQLLFVAYGAPAQDLWIASNRRSLATIRVAMGVGGAFDYLAGHVQRAPFWMQRAGLEWSYRLIRQPWRLKRQFVLVKFIWLVWRSRRSTMK